MLEYYASKDNGLTGTRSIHKVQQIEKIQENCWINLYSPTEQEINTVVNELNIPPEFIRYPLDEEERPRIDFDDDTGNVLVIVDIPYSRREEGIIKYETTPLGIIICDKHIVTVSLKQMAVLDNFIDNRIKDLNVAFRTRFTIQILYAVAKDYLRLLRFIDQTLENVEIALKKEISNTYLYKMLELDKSLVYFTSSLRSNEAVLEKLLRGRVLKIYDEDEDLLEDVVIEYKQAHEMAEIYTTIVNHTMDIYGSIINNNVNDIMKILAAATICLTLPDLIGSFFGQNCPMPWDETFVDNPVPFIALLIGCLASVIISFIFLRKKKFL